jgi:multidrug efflux pump subunit AcrA (membrane-fusion protein)
MKSNFIFFFLTMASGLVISCHHANTDSEEEEVSPEQIQTPVTVTSISNQPLSEYAELNATASFLQDNIVKSNVNGYVKSVNTKIGHHVTAGQTLFILKTKEAQSLGNTISKLDSSFHFSGIVRITAPEAGYVTLLPHQLGDYVQDGEQLAEISNSNSFGFVLNVPYELNRYVTQKKEVEVILPDSTHLKGIVASFMPILDSTSQTQRVLVKVTPAISIPENLIAKVRILKSQKTNVVSLPKQAVLSDESQTNFWVMKMIDSVRAVKVPVVKGIEADGRVEVVRPQFTPGDKILLTGNYGLPDTARVRIVKRE